MESCARLCKTVNPVATLRSPPGRSRPKTASIYGKRRGEIFAKHFEGLSRTSIHKPGSVLERALATSPTPWALQIQRLPSDLAPWDLKDYAGVRDLL